MKRILVLGSVLFAVTFAGCTSTGGKNISNDDHWLNENSIKTTSWVSQKKSEVLERMNSDVKFQERYSKTLDILQSQARLAEVSLYGDLVFSFWRDSEHKMGIWRISSWSSYKSGNPKWDTLIDFDKLNFNEKTNFSLSDFECFGTKSIRCFVYLSSGGGDRTEIREFDLAARKFVKDGFNVPLGWSRLTWLDLNTVLLDDGRDGSTLTKSNYPFVIKLWKRGNSIESSDIVYQGKKDDVRVQTLSYSTDLSSEIVIARLVTLNDRQRIYFAKGKTRDFDLPKGSQLKGIFQGQVIFLCTESIEGKRVGSIFSSAIEDVVGKRNRYRLVFEPEKSQTFSQLAITSGSIYLNILEDVKSKIVKKSFSNGEWNGKDLSFEKGTITFQSSSERSPNLIFTFEDLTTPISSYAIEEMKSNPSKLYATPEVFDSSRMIVEQNFAIAKDGEKIPYFLVRSKNISLNGANPTLLYGYGGFGVSLTPSYLNVSGKLWVEEGGVYVFANIRGGGEYGPEWHNAAKKHKKQTSFDDFISIAQDLIDRKITSFSHLGIRGGSNGGLLVAATAIQRPDLFSAVVSESALLDMLEFHKTGSGNAWIEEYGNPDLPEDAFFISKYSPYQNLNESKDYPEMFFLVSLNDERVGPGHSRRMAHRMNELKKPVLYFESAEGGHGGSNAFEEEALKSALIYTYLWNKLK